MKLLITFLLSLFSFGLLACTPNQKQESRVLATTQPTTSSMEIATFAGGCFWCTEAVFQQLDGVEKVISGYAGGTVKNPAYREVVTGRTGHAEVVQITYDPAKISFEELLEVHFATHDPTTLNRQGNDVGTQYRSSIFYHNDQQKAAAEQFIAQLTANKAFADPIVTQLEPLDVFYEAENYHQDYFELNKTQPYCTFVVKPKVDKTKKLFKGKLKPGVGAVN
jgi:peptide-methionine (S)-S-oxide reductase